MRFWRAILVACALASTATMAGRPVEAFVRVGEDWNLPGSRFDSPEIKRKACGGVSFGAIEDGLRWLTEQQAEDGSWSGQIEESALALLAFFGDGHTPARGEWKEHAALGVAWLVGRQDASTGAIGDLREHTLATSALLEAHVLEPDGGWRAPLDLALGHLLSTRTAGAGWGDDPVVSAWATMTLYFARRAEIDVADEVMEELRTWIRARVEPSGRVDLPQGSLHTKECATAALLFPRLIMRDGRFDKKRLPRQLDRLVRDKALPDADDVDFEYWYWGTLAIGHGAGERWKTWAGALFPTLLGRSVRGSDGSWATGEARTRATALAVLTLEMPYRYVRVPKPKPKPKPEPSTKTAGVAGSSGGKFGGRFGGRRNLRVAGGKGTEEALRNGLLWIVNAQKGDGSWDVGDTPYKLGTSALALLALLGDGNTLREGPHKEALAKGLNWLLEQQDEETGRFGPGAGPGAMYEHAVATLAVVETYYFEKLPSLKPKAQKAVGFIAAARNPSGVWRYAAVPDGENDTSVTSWMFFALRSAQEAGLDVDRKAISAVADWLDTATDPKTGRIGYDRPGSYSGRVTENRHYPPERGEAMTAAGLLMRFFQWQTPSDTPMMTRHANLLLKRLPEWDESGLGCDMYYWYYGTYALHQMGGRHWKAWNPAMKKAVLGAQRDDGELAGSWDPVGPWGHAGGRVYSTAMMTLCLEVYFRYARVTGRR